MKKIICIITALILCLSLAAPVFATENGFVPSIGYKPSPEIVPVENEDGEQFVGVIRDRDGNILDYVGHGCLMVTPIAHVWDEEIEVPRSVEELLLKVYNALNDGTMKIPYEKHEANLEPANMVIRDLFDARWVCEEHRRMVEEAGITFEITFDLAVAEEIPLFVMTYDEAADDWNPIVKTVNNGDGTVTCTFEHLCAVEFSVPVDGYVPSDDGAAPCPLLWIILLILALIGIVAAVIIKKKKKAAV